jgi:excisionase family DNA binding protein
MTGGLPDPYRHLLGGDPPAVVISARVAALLDRMALDRIRATNRGSDRELDETLSAVHLAAMSYLEHLATSKSGSVEVPSAPDSPESGHDQIGCAEAAERLGVSRRQVVNLVEELRGRKVGGQWVFNIADVDDLLARRAG